MERNKLFQEVTFTLRDGTVLEAEGDKATAAIEQFKNNTLVKLPGEDGKEIFVYPHSVSYIEVSRTTTTESFTDDVCE